MPLRTSRLWEIPAPAGLSGFHTTRWTVLSAAGAEEGPAQSLALEQFCRTYWYPIYAFIRRRGHESEAARDLTQGFFEKILACGWLVGVERRETRFCTLLLTLVKNHLATQHTLATRQKRGGGVPAIPLEEAAAEAWFGAEPATGESPDRLFERRWAHAVLEAALTDLRGEYETSGKQRLFTVLSPYLSREPRAGDYEKAGLELGLTSNAVGVAVFRLRAHYRAQVREEVAAGLRDPQQVEEELRHLAAAL